MYHDVRAWVRCAVIDRLNAGSSTIFAAQALESHIERDVDVSDGEGALVYHDRTWHRLGDHSRI
ncbi:hypothetical protein GCM10025876_25030 [Demequina litorisediminis]|uniref:Uncharacterized protein n=1 Tax=Demequina litorisediminis TaxID=1849022 RepID=A0ABQ6IHV7_9MICO|nr:hypothetical protein GCM10025876_25030 [Demequina litorisediminis]